MSRKTLLALVVLALLGISLVSWSAPAPPTKDKEATRAEVLSNNPVLVSSTSEKVAHVLEQPRIRSVGGRSFVVGKAVGGTNYVKERFEGKVIWIPLDKVTEMVEFGESE